MRCSTRVFHLLAATLVVTFASSAFAQSGNGRFKLGPLARARADHGNGVSRVIVRAPNAASLSSVAPAVALKGGRLGRELPNIHARVAYLPDTELEGLADESFVSEISLDRPVRAGMERTGATVGATAIREALGFDGSGVGVAIIDSGVTFWHDDLGGPGAGGQRIDEFVDFVNGRQRQYDDYGHGTHVAGIIGGNGFDSGGARQGIAPGAHLVVLKVLDNQGAGYISDVIAALGYAVEHKDALNIRIVNLSVAASVHESYDTDPLTLAAKEAVEAGLVVVAAAGNAGRNSTGHAQYGSVTAPGNAPWVLTVGASSHMGTADRADDTTAGFSSRGPTAVDYTAKPDLVAPGVGIESLSAPESAFYTSKVDYLLGGSVSTPFLPYLSLSGTSMAAPVVSGTVALMLQANPALTPNEVKAILQYTSQVYDGYDALTQGAGFLNAKGAVELAQFFANPSSVPDPMSSGWSTQIIWANHRVRGGRLTPGANAWSADVMWGAASTSSGERVEWGVICASGACETEAEWSAWSAACSDPTCSTVAWGAEDSANVVWGSSCGGSDCQQVWSVTGAGSTVLGANGDDTVVWGSSGDDTVVWGSNGDDTVVWGSNGDDTVVWGSSCTDHCDPIVWNVLEP